MLLHQIARSSHFQFWMLSTLEWRLNSLSKNLRALDEKIKADNTDAPPDA